jgi:uncharacterized DUF497 family protein
MVGDVADDLPPGFEWDPVKARRNDAIRGRPSFREATTAFLDPDRREAVDWTNSSEAEDRFRLVGLTALGHLVTVAFTFRANRVRIISARPATRPEIKSYEARR